jgi:predicted anti-sigma-YlaC factor YlaD
VSENHRVRDEEVVDRRTVKRAPWSPAQLVALAIGIVFIVFGAIALGRGTFDTSEQFLHQEFAVADFHHTTLLGSIELGFGLLMLLAAVVPGAARGLMTVLAVLAFGFGLVVLIDPPAELHQYLGVHDRNAWLYVLTGGVAMIAAMASPVIFNRDRRLVARRRDEAVGTGY